MRSPWGHIFTPARPELHPKIMTPDSYSRQPADAFDPGEQAERCRRLARTVTDQRTLEALRAMASEYEARSRSRDNT
jgi:hypothetical protein